MNQILLAAGLLGVGMAEALKRLVSQQARRKAIPFVVGGIVAGAGACYYMNYALFKGTPELSEILGVLVVLIAVIVRFRQ